MQLFIKSLSSKTLTVNVQQDDSVSNIKDIIHDKEGYPTNIQNLTYNGYNLRDNISIKDSNIHNNDILELSFSLLGGVQINVKSLKKEPLKFEMNLCDTIQLLKSQIQDKNGIPLSEQKLSFRGKKLDNSDLLSSIRNLESSGQATLLLVHKREPKSINEKLKDSAPKLCSNNCGFYGTSENNGLCSSCFNNLKNSKSNEEKKNEEKDSLLKKEEENQNSLDNDNTTDNNIIQTDFSHCWKCNKKTGLFGFMCRCGYSFCSSHRYNDKHDCTFNFRELGTKHLQDKLTKLEDTKRLFN